MSEEFKSIKELEKGCGDKFNDNGMLNYCGEEIEIGTELFWLCPKCKAKLQQTKEILKIIKKSKQEAKEMCSFIDGADSLYLRKDEVVEIFNKLKKQISEGKKDE